MSYSVNQPYQRIPPIVFIENGHLGVSLERALSGNVNGLHNAHTMPQVSPAAKKITLRIAVRTRYLILDIY